MAEATATRPPRAAARRPAPKRRPAAAVAGLQRPKRGALLPFPAWFRWARVALLVVGVVVGLPLAHAIFGEIVALLGGVAMLGFLVGRWTAPGAG